MAGGFVSYKRIYGAGKTVAAFGSSGFCDNHQGTETCGGAAEFLTGRLGTGRPLHM